MADSRLNSVLALQEILEKKVFLNEALEHFSAADGSGRAFQNMLLLTALRKLVFLRKILKIYSKKKLPASSVFAQYALFLGMTELLYLDTPPYAVINSYVDMVKKQLDKYVAGFVNAVLRKVSADKENLLAQDNGNFFPQDFIHILRTSYGKKTLAKLEQAAQLEPCLDLTATKPTAQLAEQVGGNLLPLGTIRLNNGGAVPTLYGYVDGLWWVQDFAASLPVKTLGNLTGKRVLDLCAAPGGKTAQLIAAGAKVTAVDISEPRLQTLKDNLHRLKLQAEEIICANGLDFLQNFDGHPYDIILLDAPCSATGTLRRHPELVHLKKSADIHRQTELQQKLLQAVSPALAASGILLYCVCSLCKEEGEEQIENFIKQNANFQKISLQNFVPKPLKEILTEDGYIRTLPQHLSDFRGTDGFFIAKLKKVSD